MSARKILFLFILVGTIFFVYSEHSSLWGQGIFPEDENSFLLHAKRVFHDSIKKSNVLKNDKICKTQECKKIADEFLKSLNKSVDPCNDFYDFTCGGWSANNPIPPSLPAWSRYMIFQENVHHRIKEILETKPEPSDILPVRQAKKWYRSCMDTERLEKRGVKAIESILIRAGGWPISMDEGEWDADEYTWQEVERSYAHLTGSYTFYTVQANPSYHRIFGSLTIGAPDLPLSEYLPLKYRNYTGNDYDEYVGLVSKIASLFVQHSQANVSEEKITKEAGEIVEFEKKIYELKKEYDYAFMKLDDFVEWYDKNLTESNDDPKSKIDWHSLIQELFDIVNIKVHPWSDIEISELTYIRGIGELLRRTPARTIVNYIHWNFIGNMLTYTSEAAREDLFKLINEEYGIKEMPPRWLECVGNMKMSHAASYVFVNKYFTNHTESTALGMFKNIQTEMNEQIERSNWLDAESKILAKDKLNSMKIFLGFPDWYKNNKSVVDSYKGLVIGNEYFDNALSYIKYNNKMNLKKYTDSEDLEALDPWIIDPITVNALYNPHDNFMTIPAAEIQPPFLSSQIPDYVKYGIAGLVIGHEMGHGFDDSGIEYGKDGRGTKLSEKMLKNYYQRADCFTDQFDEYYGETKAPETTEILWRYGSSRSRMSQITRGENIADSTGMQTVFEAYQKIKKPEKNLKLPGFEEFTEDQLFFLSFAAMWCEIETPEYESKKEEEIDEHSPARLRVISSVSNTKGFAEVFNCPPGSPMNPTNKCNIWQKSGNTLQKQLARIRRKPNRWEGQWKS